MKTVPQIGHGPGVLSRQGTHVGLILYPPRRYQSIRSNILSIEKNVASRNFMANQDSEVEGPDSLDVLEKRGNAVAAEFVWGGSAGGVTMMVGTVMEDWV